MTMKHTEDLINLANERIKLELSDIERKSN